MQRSRRLPPSQNIHGRREHRVKARRQGEASPNHQREKYEDDRQVCGPLHCVVGVRFPLVRPLEAYMPCDHCPERLPGSVRRRRKQVASKVAGPQTPKCIRQACQHRGPRGLKVQIAAPSILVGQHIAIPGRNHRPRRRDRYSEQRTSSNVACLAPIKTRVRDHNLGPAD